LISWNHDMSYRHDAANNRSFITFTWWLLIKTTTNAFSIEDLLILVEARMATWLCWALIYHNTYNIIQTRIFCIKVLFNKF
jgi:hypothetical protein